DDMSIKDLTVNFEYFQMILPNTFDGFLIAYAIGLLFVMVVFTAILFERSFRLKGAIIGAIYIAISFFLFISPFVVVFMTGKMYLYVGEYVLLMSGLWFVIFIASLLISRHLITKKITV